MQLSVRVTFTSFESQQGMRMQKFKVPISPKYSFTSSES
ncbi:hypothetical protein LEP1GSC070_0431 [Leptospira santarosai str. AIM]|nr:hypothetical protein LEP1GSC070_0431 [Leptospira santarosai str. AIM]